MSSKSRARGSSSNPPWAIALLAALLVGIGLLIIFRHRASLGGINIVALLVQDKTGFKAGYVQMIFDVIIVASAFAVVSPLTVLLSEETIEGAARDLVGDDRTTGRHSLRDEETP